MGFVRQIVGLALIAMLGFGIQKIYVSLNARAPYIGSCGSYERADPNDIWLKLSDCIVDFEHTVKLEKKGNTEYFAPVVASGEDPSAHLVIQLSDDDELIARYLFDDLSETEKAIYTDDTFRGALQKAVEPRSISGVVEVGLDADDTRAAGIQRNISTLSSDFKILDSGEPPSLVTGVLLAGVPAIVSLMVIAGIIIERRERRDTKKVAQSVSLAVSPTGSEIVDLEGIAVRRKLCFYLSYAIALAASLSASLAALSILAAILPDFGQSGWGTLLFTAIHAFVFLLIFVVILLTINPIRAAIISILPISLTIYGALAARDGGFLIFTIIILGMVAAVILLKRVTISNISKDTFDLAPEWRDPKPGFFASGKIFSILYYQCISTLLFTAAILLLAVLLAIERGIGYFFGIAPRLWNLLGPSFVRPLFHQSSRASRLRRCYASPTARAALAKDQRRPVLLLRSFSDDEIHFSDETIVDHLYRSDRTFEELVTDRLWHVGPVIAIGRPGEQVPMSGAVREYVSDDLWQARVAELAENATLIAMIVGSTKGFGWELEHICGLGYAEKVLILIPPVGHQEMLERSTRLATELSVSGQAFQFAQVSQAPFLISAFQHGSRFFLLQAMKRNTNSYASAVEIGIQTILSK